MLEGRFGLQACIFRLNTLQRRSIQASAVFPVPVVGRIGITVGVLDAAVEEQVALAPPAWGSRSWPWRLR
jgi:energy-converting hydrogenase Eha subunit A